jgi:hypothetical protein
MVLTTTPLRLHQGAGLAFSDQGKNAAAGRISQPAAVPHRDADVVLGLLVPSARA